MSLDLLKLTASPCSANQERLCTTPTSVRLYRTAESWSDHTFSQPLEQPLDSIRQLGLETIETDKQYRTAES